MSSNFVCWYFYETSSELKKLPTKATTWLPPPHCIDKPMKNSGTLKDVQYTRLTISALRSYSERPVFSSHVSGQMFIHSKKKRQHRPTWGSNLRRSTGCASPATKNHLKTIYQIMPNK